MADIEIIRESADGFTHQGHSVSYTDTYVKVRRSFRRRALKTLRGAPLSVFWAVVLAEDPPGIKQICEDTGIDSPTTVCKALDFLVERQFLQETGRNGKNGNKVYAAVSYTWSGPDRNAPQDIVSAPDGIPKYGIPERAPKNGIPSQKVESEDRPKWNPTKNSGKRASKNGIRPHDMNDDLSNENHLKESFIHDRAATRKIFQAAGIEGKNLDLLAGTVTPEIAQGWARWLETVNRGRWTRPEGFVFKQLSADPTKRAPFAPNAEPAPRVRKPTITGKLAILLEPGDDTGDTEP